MNFETPNITKIDQGMNVDQIAKSVIFTHSTFVWTVNDNEWNRGGLTLSPLFGAGVNEELKFRIRLVNYDPNGKPTCEVKLRIDAIFIERCTMIDGLVKTFEIGILDKKNQMTDICNLNLKVTEFPYIAKFIDRDIIKNTNFDLLENNKLKIQIKVKIPIAVSNFTYEKLCEANDSMEHFFEMGRFCDTVFIVNGKKLRAHKIILASHSKVFLKMIENDIQENKISIINITDTEYEILQEVLRFIYTGRIKSIENIIYKLTIAAKKYSLSTLIEICEQFLCKQLDINNAFDTLTFAEEHKLSVLKIAICNFIIANAKLVVGSTGYNSVKKKNPVLLASIFEAIAQLSGSNSC